MERTDRDQPDQRLRTPDGVSKRNPAMNSRAILPRRQGRQPKREATAIWHAPVGRSQTYAHGARMSQRQTLIALLMVCAGATGVFAQPDTGDIGATEADYGWWRDARFGIFIHWGPGAFVHKNSLAWEKPPDGRPPYRELGYMADVENPDAVPPEIATGEYKQYRSTRLEVGRTSRAAGADRPDVATPSICMSRNAGPAAFSSYHRCRPAYSPARRSPEARRTGSIPTRDWRSVWLPMTMMPWIRSLR
jgi:hypothetical protein